MEDLLSSPTPGPSHSQADEVNCASPGCARGARHSKSPWIAIAIIPLGEPASIYVSHARLGSQYNPPCILDSVRPTTRRWNVKKTSSGTRCPRWDSCHTISGTSRVKGKVSSPQVQVVKLITASYPKVRKVSRLQCGSKLKSKVRFRRLFAQVVSSPSSAFSLVSEGGVESSGT